MAKTSSVTLHVDNVYTYLSGQLHDEVFEDLRKEIGFCDEDAYWKAKKQKNKWDGWVTTLRRNKRDGTYFPTGVVGKVKSFLKEQGIVFNEVDGREAVEPNIDLSLNAGSFEERPYQKEAIYKASHIGRGLIRAATGSGKCLGRGTPVLMFDGTIKKVEDVKVGDLLMGPDSQPRKVFSLASGRERLFKIIPVSGDPFVVNESHILSLKLTNGAHVKGRRGGDIVNMSVLDYLNQTKTFKHCAKGYRSGINFKHQNVSVDPYFLGVWLGDGNSNCMAVTTKDKEIVDFLYKFASDNNINCKKRHYNNGRCPLYALSTHMGGRHDRNPVLNHIKDMGLLNNKHIPNVYKANSREIRLQVLAGLIDTDGHISRSSCDLVFKNERLANDTCFIARSLGYRATLSECKKTCTNNGVTGTYYRICVSGDLSKIPVKIPRKKSKPRRQKKDCLVFGFETEFIGVGDYFGFEIDGDRLFLLGDFTVTHNTFIASGIIAELNVKPFIFFVPSQDLLKQAHDELSRFILHRGLPLDVGTIWGGNKDIRDVNVMTVQTAVRALGEKYEKYDDEETWSDEDNLDEASYKDISKLIRSCKGMIADECLTGDSLIITKSGIKRLDELKKNIGEEVLSFSGTSVVWRKFTDFMVRGRRSVIKITLSTGEVLKCTKNHPIMTSRGWVEAGRLKLTDQILSYANADAGQKYVSNTEALANIPDMYWGTSVKDDPKSNGQKSTNKYKTMPLYANVAVAKGLISNTPRYLRLLKTKVVLNTENTFTGMIKGHQPGGSFYPHRNIRQLWVQYWETLLSFCRQSVVEISDCHLTTESYRKNGQNIKRRFYEDCLLNHTSQTMGDMETERFHAGHLAFRALMKFMLAFIEKVKKEYLNSGWTVSEKLGWHGGSETMVVGINSPLHFILKDSQKEKLDWRQSGFPKNTVKPMCIKPNRILSCTLLQVLLRKYRRLSGNTFPNVCNTRLSNIQSIESCGVEDVYDITVDDTHCFFANGILVHNCQHWAAKSCQIVSKNATSCKHRFGFSATPYRDKGDDILIESCFGRAIVDIPASDLIKLGYLVKPDIFFIPMVNMRGSKYKSYPQLYKKAIVENVLRNQRVADIATAMKENGSLVLILVKHINHGKILEDIIDGSEFLHGAHSAKKRNEHIASMRKREASITIATSIFDEGIDCKPLDVLIQAGSGKSPTRALQRVGRVLRPYEGKTSATVIDFEDRCKFFQGHSNKRYNMYKTEPEFNIQFMKTK